MRVHEETKVHLLTYAQQTGEKLVKPFMLVIARDTTHAARLMANIESNDFFAGRYKGKVIPVSYTHLDVYKRQVRGGPDRQQPHPVL